MADKLKSISVSIFVSVLSFFAILGTAVFCEHGAFDTFWNDIRMEMLSDRFYAVWNLAFLLFITASVARTTYAYSSSKKSAFLEKHEGPLTFPRDCLSVLSASDFWVQFITFSLLLYPFPMELVLEYVKNIFFVDFSGTAEEAKLLSWLTLLPFLFVMLFINTLSVHKGWKRPQVFGKNKEESKWKPVWTTILVCVFYFFASHIAPYIVPMAFSVVNIIKAFGITALLIFIAIIVGISAFFYLRTARKVRRFMKELRSLCREKAFPLQEEQSPYLSVFGIRKGYDFTVKNGAHEYRCKIVPFIFKSTPTVFTDKGICVRRRSLRIMRYELFHITSLSNCAFESDEVKVLIVLPKPKKLFVGMTGATQLRAADTGEKIGDYQIFTDKGFLGALERDCIGVTRA